MKAYEKPEVKVQSMSTDEQLMHDGCISKWVSGITTVPNPRTRVVVVCTFDNNHS